MGPRVTKVRAGHIMKVDFGLFVCFCVLSSYMHHGMVYIDGKPTVANRGARIMYQLALFRMMRHHLCRTPRNAATHRPQHRPKQSNHPQLRCHRDRQGHIPLRTHRSKQRVVIERCNTARTSPLHPIHYPHDPLLSPTTRPPPPRQRRTGATERRALNATTQRARRLLNTTATCGLTIPVLLSVR